MTIYCSFCDNEATCQTQDDSIDHPTYFCNACADAFEYGKVSPDQELSDVGEDDDE
jgi:hypothetical protein